MANSFKRAPDNRYFEDYILGTVHESGSIKVDEQEVIEFGKRYVRSRIMSIKTPRKTAFMAV